MSAISPEAIIAIASSRLGSRHLDVFAFVQLAAAALARRGGIIVGQKAEKPLLHRARADKTVGDQLQIGKGAPAFFHRFPRNPRFRRIAIQLSRYGFDKKLPVAGFKRRPAELADQHHPVPGAVNRQNCGGLAQFIAFPSLFLPDAITPPIVEDRLAQNIVIVGKDLQLAQPDPVADLVVFLPCA